MFNFLKSWQLTILFLVIFSTFVYMVYKHRKNLFDVLVLLMFYPGLFEYINYFTLNTIYRPVVAVLAGYIFISDNKNIRKVTSDNYGFLFSGFFLVLILLLSYVTAPYNTLTIFLSQSSRYFVAFFLFYIVKTQIYDYHRGEEILNLFYQIFCLELLYTIVNFLLFRSIIEGRVASFSYVGGAYGTSLPIIGLFVLWLHTKGNFSGKDWLFAFGLLALGVLAAKRAVVFIYPLVLIALMTFSKGIKINKYIILGILFAPLLFYLAVRITPSLNPEYRIWGSFDIDFVMNYSEQYQFGDEEHIKRVRDIDARLNRVSLEGGTVEKKYVLVEGRGAATRAVVERLINEPDKYSEEYLGYGFGLYHGNMNDSYGYDNVDIPIKPTHKGSSSGVFQSYLASGYWGILAMILFGFIPFFYFKQWRLGLIIGVMCLWEYFMYTGLIFRTPAFMAVIFFALHYTNYQIDLQRNQRRLYNESLSYSPGI